ncbi:phospholipid carrier-dependent glycosyltransferase [Nordella sp. HKS 07]|uniref:glycosyltransferase family 39 protein n=1 Tax=Nordella sp. HKS 07 TaxID=2712222 RepID=UPI0013E128BA|nr:glycosyltransferase family 39 protein [Nordella sp. HKS 07]QIG50158.1 phospholipid carrier-dependent glycosyltransferase [Nordella sp. HKS 07]
MTVAGMSRPCGSIMPCDGAATSDSQPAVRMDRRYWTVGTSLMLLSLAVFLVNTRHGIGILPDTTRYMGINDLPYDAPVYAWLVRLPALMGIDMDAGAKALGLIFACANTFLVWHLLFRATGKYRYAIVGTALIVLAPQYVAVHASAMSEPPFLFFLLLTLLTILRYFKTEKRGWLVASAVVLAVASLTRFAGPTLGGAIALSLLLNPRHDRRRRIADAVLFGLVSAGIFVFWVALSQIRHGHSLGRELWFYGNMGPEEWRRSFGSLMAWLLPDDVPNSLRAIVFLIFALAAVGLITAHSRRALERARTTIVVHDFLPLILGLFTVCYMAFMALAATIEANLLLNSRYALPPYVMTVMAVTIALAGSSGLAGASRMIHDSLVVLAIIVLSTHSARTVVRSLDAYHSGIGYAGLEWKQSPTMLAIRDLPGNALVYSNGPDAIAYVLKRPASFIPARFQLRTGVEDPSNTYEQQLSRLQHAAETQRTFIVMLDKVDWRFYRASEADLMKHLSLVNVATKPDGRIYEVLPAVTKE